MQLSETIKLYMTQDQHTLITSSMDDYISAVNALVKLAVSGTSIKKYSSKDVDANLPSAIRAQIAQDARSIVKKHYGECHKTVLKNRKRNLKLVAPRLPVLKRPCMYINNQNYKIKDSRIEFPLIVDGKSKRISVKTSLTDRQLNAMKDSKLGTMRIVYKGRKIVAQIVYEADEPKYADIGNVMGVDLGIKCPAVSYISDGNIRFYGNGRKNKYMRRHYRYLRKKLQEAKHIDAVKRINDKEQRIMKDIDHKISHNIVATAVAHGVKTIKLEQLSNIRSTTRTSRKNNHSLHTWSFYRLAQYIEYKAKLAGIAVEYVNPVYTSQTCPVCGHVHHANDRSYTCKCGFHIHRDLLGAMNICNSTEYVGDGKVNSEAVRHTA